MLEGFRLGQRGVLGVFVVREVAGGAVEVEVADVGCEDLVVAVFLEEGAKEVLEFLADDGAAGHPEDEALAGGVVDVEEAEFASEFAVVAQFGLFAVVEVGVEFFLCGEGGAVDALELDVFFVAAVVGAGDGEEFEGAGPGGAGDVGAGTQVDEFAVFVEGDGFAFGDVGQASGFVAGLADFLEECGGQVAGKFDAFEGLVFSGDAAHFFFDGFKVFGGEFFGQVHIVVEALVGGWADVELGVGVKAQEGGGEDVCAGVAEFLEWGHGFGVHWLGFSEWRCCFPEWTWRGFKWGVGWCVCMYFCANGILGALLYVFRKFGDQFFEVVDFVATGHKDGVGAFNDDKVFDAQRGDEAALRCGDGGGGVEQVAVAECGVFVGVRAEVFGQGVPGANVVPLEGGFGGIECRGVFADGVIDGDFGERGEVVLDVFLLKLRSGGKIFDEVSKRGLLSFCFFEEVSGLPGEDAGVPEETAGVEEFLCVGLVGFFDKFVEGECFFVNGRAKFEVAEGGGRVGGRNAEGVNAVVCSRSVGQFTDVGDEGFGGLYAGVCRGEDDDLVRAAVGDGDCRGECSGGGGIAFGGFAYQALGGDLWAVLVDFWDLEVVCEDARLCVG